MVVGIAPPHYSNQCPKGKGKGAGGKGKGGGKADGKGGKGGKAGGKGPKGGCLHCGGAHYATNCPKGNAKGKGVPTYSMNSGSEDDWSGGWTSTSSTGWASGCLLYTSDAADE